MKHSFIVAPAVCALVFAILACNAPLAASSSQPDYVSTITAQAALIGQGGTQAAGTPGAPSAATSASSPITATVTANTNCRSGPGTAYAVVTTLSAGAKLVVVGQDTADDYWIVNTPDGKGTCWLWGQVATLTGDTKTLAQVAPSAPPTAKPTKAPTKAPTSVAAPSAPTDFGASFSDISCHYGTNKLGTRPYVEEFKLSWGSSDASVTTYEIFRDGTKIGAVEAPALSYTDTISIITTAYTADVTQEYTYGIDAVNKAGVHSKMVTVKLQCPP